jgi:hypothetical protein
VDADLGEPRPVAEKIAMSFEALEAMVNRKPGFVPGQTVRLKFTADLDAKWRDGVKLGDIGIVDHLGGLMKDDVWVNFGDVILECDPEWIEGAMVS